MVTKKRQRPEKSSLTPKRSTPALWLAEVLPNHERLTRSVKSLIENMLLERGIEILSVTGRTKTSETATEKIARKKYRNPRRQLTDLSGIRVVTFLESQVDEVAKVVRELFTIDVANSLDRAQVLGSDKIGYRSTHFVCELGPDRHGLPEYKSLDGLKFEIQIRTVLQHGWAELAHDRAFKFGPGLPTHIQRKLNLYSGMLEIVDGAFDNLAKEIDEYSAALEGKSLDQISNEEISRVTLEKYLEVTAKTHKINLSNLDLSPELFAELAHFGIQTIGDLEKITTEKNIDAYTSIKGTDTAVGFIRQILMLEEIDKYFSGPFDWKGLDVDSYSRLKKKYGETKIAELLRLYDIDVLNDDLEEGFPPPNDVDREIPF